MQMYIYEYKVSFSIMLFGIVIGSTLQKHVDRWSEHYKYIFIFILHVLHKKCTNIIYVCIFIEEYRSQYMNTP